MKHKTISGVTLIEILMALLILGIGMSFLYTMFPLAIRMSNDIQTLGKISFFAQKKIEELKTSNETLIDSKGEEPEFNWKVTVQNFIDENNITLTKAQLDLEWLRGDTPQKKSFVTYFKKEL